MDEQKKQERRHEIADHTSQEPIKPAPTPALPSNKQETQRKQNTVQNGPVLETPQQLRKSAKKYLRAQRWYKAGDEFLKLLDYDAHDVDALLGLALTLDATERYDSLLPITQRLLALVPNSAQSLAYRARALQKLSRLSEATIANDQALLLDTKLGLAWINRSGLQLLQRKYPEALRSAQRAVTLAAKDARAWANLGIALFNFNRIAESLDAFDQSLKLDEDQIAALQIKTEIFCRMGRMREALPLIKRALLLNPLDTISLKQAIQAYRTLEMYKEMKEYSRYLINTQATNDFAWEHLARAERALGEFAEANEALDQLLLLDGTNVRFWTLKADTTYRLEHYREAVTIAEQARNLNPDYAPANRIYEKALRMMYQRKDKGRSKQVQP